MRHLVNANNPAGANAATQNQLEAAPRENLPIDLSNNPVTTCVPVDQQPQNEVQGDPSLPQEQASPQQAGVQHPATANDPDWLEANPLMYRSFLPFLFPPVVHDLNPSNNPVNAGMPVNEQLQNEVPRQVNPPSPLRQQEEASPQQAGMQHAENIFDLAEAPSPSQLESARQELNLSLQEMLRMPIHPSLTELLPVLNNRNTNNNQINAGIPVNHQLQLPHQLQNRAPSQVNPPSPQQQEHANPQHSGMQDSANANNPANATFQNQLEAVSQQNLPVKNNLNPNNYQMNACMPVNKQPQQPQQPQNQVPRQINPPSPPQQGQAASQQAYFKPYQWDSKPYPYNPFNVPCINKEAALQLGLSRQRNLLKIQQLQQNLEAAKQKELQFKAAREKIKQQQQARQQQMLERQNANRLMEQQQLQQQKQKLAQTKQSILMHQPSSSFSPFPLRSLPFGFTCAPGYPKVIEPQEWQNMDPMQGLFPTRGENSSSNEPSSSQTPSIDYALVELQASEIFSVSLVKEVLKQTGKKFKSVHELCDAILEIEERKKKHKLSQSSQELKNVKKLRCEVTEENEILLCKICMEQQINTLFEPCMHIATCMACALTLEKCPMCRSVITKKAEIYI